MLVKSYGAAVSGIDAILVTVEVTCSKGFGMTIVGLPDAAVKESFERMNSAFNELGYDSPSEAIVVNMAPADLRKEGAAFDLPIAVSVLCSTEQVQTDALAQYMIMGELSLDGSVKPIRGALPMAIMAREYGFKGFILPRDNASEAAVVNRLDVYGVDNLSEVVEILQGTSTLQPIVVNTREEFARSVNTFDFDFRDVKGQEKAKRALEVACAGGHNILLVGSPGSGKSMLAKRLPSILPPLSLAEALETTKIHSVAGKLHHGSRLMSQRPFRAPHHTISPVALCGGGTNPMPGEISLAHNGILYLDEFPEFGRQVLEVMRQPLEDRIITVSRAKYTIDYPASFMLVASMNPCPCGYYMHPTRECTCAPGEVQRYLNRISGPLMDRIDLHIDVQPISFDEMAAEATGEDSATIRERVIRARQIQQARFSGERNVHCNAQMTSRLIAQYVKLDEQSIDKLRSAIVRFKMSSRAYDRILRVARTIADLEGSEDVLSSHISEAISYRTLDRDGWSVK